MLATLRLQNSLGCCAPGSLQLALGSGTSLKDMLESVFLTQVSILCSLCGTCVVHCATFQSNIH